MPLGPIIFLAAALFQTGAAPAQPAQPPAVALFQHLEDDWSLALANRDQFALDNLLAFSFIDISASAEIRTRNQFIADSLAALPEPLLSIEQKVINVREVGDVAVVDGTYALRWREPSSHIRDERGVFTHIYQRAHDRWAAINAQRTAVVDQVEGSGKASGGSNPKKKSSAELPFHIPLLSHSSDTNSAPAAPPNTPQ